MDDGCGKAEVWKDGESCAKKMSVQDLMKKATG